MAQFGKKLFISPSQEEVLEALAGWDDTGRGAEYSSQSSLERVFDVTGSSLCSGPSQEAVEFVSPTEMSSPSPRTTLNVALEEREEDSYNEAFESDRSESPHRTISWSLPAGAHGCKDDPKSPATSTTLNAVALEELEKSPRSENLDLVREVEVSTRPLVIRPEAAGATIRVRAEPEMDQEARAAGEDAEERSGNGPGSATGRAAEGGGVSFFGIGLVSPQGSPLPRGSPAWNLSGLAREGFGSGNASALTSLRRKQKESQSDSQPALSGERNTVLGLEGETSVRSIGNSFVPINDTLDQIANSVQVNVQVIDQMEVVTSGDKFKRVEHELDTMERAGEVGVCADRVVTHSTDLKDELGTSRAAEHCQSGIELLGGQEKPRERLLSPTSCKSLIDAANSRSADKTGVPAAAVSTEGVQYGPSRPPRAVQEKLDKLRSPSKRARSESFNLLRERLRTEGNMVSASTVLEAIKLRSGERPAINITAADLLKTALEVGIALPPPFHRNYFSR